MTLNRGHQVRVRTDLDPELWEVLRRGPKKGTRVEVRDEVGTRSIPETEAWLSYQEIDGGTILFVLCIGPRPGLVPIGPISDALKSEKRYLRGPSPEYLRRCVEVLRLHALGKNGSEIARELVISRRQVARVLDKERARVRKGDP